jgi:hypothetical protein
MGPKYCHPLGLGQGTHGRFRQNSPKSLETPTKTEV